MESAGDGGTWFPYSSTFFMMNFMGLSQRSRITTHCADTHKPLSKISFGMDSAASPWCWSLLHLIEAGLATLNGATTGVYTARLGTTACPEYVYPVQASVNSVPVGRLIVPR